MSAYPIPVSYGFGGVMQKPPYTRQTATHGLGLGLALRLALGRRCR